MKQIFILFMVAMCATMFTACSKDDDKAPLDNEEGKEGVITMVVEDEDEDEDEYEYLTWIRVATFKEGEIITIDWGDGHLEEFKSFRIYDDEEDQVCYVIGTYDVEEDDYNVVHEYSNRNPHTITIKGNIKRLDCYDNNLTSLNVSGCTTLTELDCYYNNLTSLDVSKNTKLTELDCDYNNLTSLDVSKNTALTELDCSYNNLTSLDVSKNTALTELDCGNNNLTSLDVSKNTALTELDCYYNNLTSLDVSKNTALTYLNCYRNNLTSAALNRIFRDLPQGKTWIDEYCGYTEQSWISVHSNPGSETCDKSIAKNKGWGVD